MSKLDGIIISIILGICFIALLVSHIAGQMNSENMRVEIYISGTLSQTFELDDRFPQEIVVQGSKMRLESDGEGAYVSYSDCPNRVCVNTGKITLPGQMITCLPNRVIIKLTGGDNTKSEVDVIAK